MRIAVVHSFYTAAQPSGENTVVLQQVEALRQAGHEVRLIARYTDDHQVERGYAIKSALTVATGKGSSPEAELESFEPDVVHLHNTFPNFGTKWLEQWGHKTVVTLHNFRTVCSAGTLFRDGHRCTDCLRTPVYPAVVHACYRGSRLASMPVAAASRPGGALRRIGELCERVVVLNDDAKGIFEHALGRSVDVIPNFTPTVATGEKVDPRGWIFVGRLAAEKGVRELIEKWPAEERLDVYGHGPLSGQISHSIEARGVDIHLQGLTEHTELLASLGAYEGLILPSLWAEGLPTVALESLARQVPIIASTRMAATQELIQAGAAAPLEMPATTADIAAALNSVRARPEMRSAASLLHEKRYSTAAWVDAVQSVYTSVSHRC